MKIMYFTKYSRLGASSRLRSFQYFPYLREHGCDIKVSSLFNDRYLNQLYSKSKINKFNVVKLYLKRIYSLFSVFRYDLVVIEKELFPYFPASAEMILSFFKIKYVVDYDDAIFHNYDSSSNKIIRMFLKYKIDTVMRFSTGAVVGNDYLKDRATAVGAKNILLIPTVIDNNRYKRKNVETSENLIVGWIGSPSTLKYLISLKDVFLELSKKYKFKLHIIGGGESIGIPDIEEIINWSEATEVDEIRRFDIGIMPLENSKWAKGKCAYKLIQYMACGIPVVADPIGANLSVIENSKNGYLVESHEQWYQRLEELLVDKEKRFFLGENGYETVLKKYSIQAVFQRQLDFLEAIVNK